MNVRRIVLPLALAALAASSACQSSRKHPPQWRQLELAAPSENILWAVSAQELARMGFPLGSGADPRQLVMDSAWKVQLAPFKGDGFRQRAHLRFEGLPSGRYRIDVRIEREVNNDMLQPLDPSHAQWEPAPDDLEATQLLLHRIQARLGAQIEIGERKPSALGERR